MLIKLYWKLKSFYCYLWRPVTLGVKALILDKEHRVLLVKHSYVDGWHLPGGGVDRTETALQAVKREMAEEVGIVGLSDPELVAGVFYNTNDYKHDHILLFIVREWRSDPSLRHAGEIVADQFFKAEELPPDTSSGSRRQIENFFAGKTPQFHW